MRKLAVQHSLDAPTVDPRVHVQFSGADDVNLILRVPVPSQKRGRLEQEILRKYLQYINQKHHLERTKTEDTSDDNTSSSCRERLLV